LEKEGHYLAEIVVLIMESETAQAQGPEETPMHDFQNGAPVTDSTKEPPSKKPRLDDAPASDNNAHNGAPQRVRGLAPVKPEYAWT
jgi:tRNA-dihydrouridine synthase 3